MSDLLAGSRDDVVAYAVMSATNIPFRVHVNRDEADATVATLQHLGPPSDASRNAWPFRVEPLVLASAARRAHLEAPPPEPGAADPGPEDDGPMELSSFGVVS